MREDFAVFVISYKRPQSPTADFLRETLVDHRWYIVMDNTDPTYAQYVERYGADRILIYDKPSFIASTDTCTREKLPNSAVYARNACEHLAKVLSLDYFMVMDDDLDQFRLRYPDGKKVATQYFEKGTLDGIIDNYIEFMETNDHISWLCMLAPFSFIAGTEVFTGKYLYKWMKGYTIFLRKTSVELDWVGFISEDTITTLAASRVGKIGYALPFATFRANYGNGVGYSADGGGNSEYYEATTSFERTFYAVVACPDCVRPTLKNGRIIITSGADYSYPKVISDRYKKER